jgi:tetratricopeptide (TPR) repeat protein
MERIFLFILILIGSLRNTSFAQVKKTSFINKLKCSNYLSKGSEKYNLGRTYDALMIYKQALNVDPNSWKAYYSIATTEYDLNNFSDAKQHIDSSISLASGKADGEMYFLCARIYHNLNLINEALTFYEKAKELLGEKGSKEFEIPTLISQCEFATIESKKLAKNLRKPLSVNTKYDEYGPIFIDGGTKLFYTARLSETTGGNLNPDDQLFFEDIYYAERDSITGEYVMVPELMEDINTEGFDALNFISRDGLYALGTVNTSASKEKTTESSDLYEMTADEPGIFAGMEIIKNKSINTTFFEGGACITDSLFIDEDNFVQTLFFVSEKNATKKMTDIYSVVKKNGIFSEEIKLLPDLINTTGRETTPFISGDGRFLFFSSDALPGMGGYDIYYSENIDGKWSNPINLGATFNTVNDDTHFQYYPELNKAVMAGISENDGVFNYNIFEVDLTGLDFPFLK